MSISKHRPLVLGAALALTLLPLAAQAQRRSPLEDAPAIRKRLELRTARLEVGAGVTTTLNETFYHSLFITGKIGFHFNDWLSLAGFIGAPIANLSTGFQERVVASLPCVNGEACSYGQMPQAGTSVSREPSQQQALSSMTKIALALGAQLEFTPFTGKYSLFGALFAHYDFYGFVGAGFLSLKPTTAGIRDCGTDSTDEVEKRRCATTGFTPGGNFGVGFHTYFNEFVALNVELRDILARINPAGRDVNGDGMANNDDLTLSNTYMVGASLTFYLPPHADISP